MVDFWIGVAKEIAFAWDCSCENVCLLFDISKNPYLSCLRCLALKRWSFISTLYRSTWYYQCLAIYPLKLSSKFGNAPSHSRSDINRVSDIDSIRHGNASVWCLTCRSLPACLLGLICHCCDWKDDHASW
jgi:hypothetical protein